MGNYRQHITFGTVCGLVYSGAAIVLAGLHWMYATMAVFLSALGGLLPDLDSPSGVGLRSFTGILGVLGALVVWQGIEELKDPPGFEYHLWAIVIAYLFIRHGLRRVMVRISIHRGMCHSVPTGALWGVTTYLVYPSDHHEIRLAMAIAVGLGFLSHLVLDEMCSVDLQGARVNQAFGTAFKFWAASPFSTVVVYIALSFACWKVTKVWPDGAVIPANLASPGPAWPYPWPQSWIKDNFKEVREFAKEQRQKLPGRVDQAKKIAARELDGLPEDLGKLKDFAKSQLPDATEKLEKARDFANQNFPGAVEKAKGYAEQKKLPETLERLKKVAGEVAPSPRRR